MNGTRTRTVHVLSQYLWPDDAPTGIYAEQLATRLASEGIPVTLAGGRGSYRPGNRPEPALPIVRVSHYEGRRGNIPSTFIEYESVREAFAGYIRQNVAAGDVVIITSAPPSTIFLHRTLARKGATGIYWLQDYYPQLVRGLVALPKFAVKLLSSIWNRELSRWVRVVKAAGNLGYHGTNAVTVRNWPTLDLGPARPFVPKTALYSGNLGYGHHLPSFLALCEELRAQGFTITVQGDGPGMANLPGWIRAKPPVTDPAELLRAYWEAEVHLVAGHPDMPDAVFPSKFWNALATGREVKASGFTGRLLEEFQASVASRSLDHLSSWVETVKDVLEATAPASRAG